MKTVQQNNGGETPTTVFLTDEWRCLVKLNFEIEPAILAPCVSTGMEFDFQHGKLLVSALGFLFQNVRVLRSPIPFHRHFEEVKRRFYVRRQTPDGWRCGVLFIKEVVPRRAIAWTERTFYNEPYLTLLMLHQYQVEHPRWHIWEA